MQTIKQNDIIEKINKNKPNIPKGLIEFVIDRYLHYACTALIHGHPQTNRKTIKLKVDYSIYASLPKALQKKFRFSQRMFGYVLIPVLSDEDVKKNGYNYKPAESLINALADVADTDMIYTFMKQ